MTSSLFVFYFKTLFPFLLFQLIVTSNGPENQCPSHLPFNTSAGCTSRCPDNAFINGATCVADCGNMFVTADRRCVKTCTEGDLVRETIKLIGKDFYKEKLCVSECSPNEKIYNGSCVDTCPVSARSIDDDRCLEKCPSHKSFYKQITIQNTSYAKCLTDCDGMFLDGKQCVHSCKDDTFLDNSTCVSGCPSERPYIKDNRCIEGCPNDTLHIINNTCISHCFTDKPNVFNGTCVQKCPHFSRLQDKIMFCTDSCKNNEHVDDGECKEKCPDDKVVYNMTCLESCPEESPYLHNMQCFSTCPGNMVHLPKNNSCQHKWPSGLLRYKQDCLTECLPDQPFASQESFKARANEGVDKEMYNLSNKYNWNMACKTQCPPSKVILNNTCLFLCPMDMVRFGDKCLRNCPKYLMVQNVSSEPIDTDSVFKFKRTEKKCVQTCNENKVEYDKSCIDACPKPEMVVLNKTCLDRCPDHIPLKQQVEVRPGLFRTECVRSCKKEDVIFEKTCLERCPNDYIFIVNGNCRDEECETKRLITNNGIECVSDCSENTFLRNNVCVDSCELNETVLDRTCLDKCPVEKPLICEVDNKISCGKRTYNTISYSGESILYIYILKNSFFECIKTCPGNMLRQNQKCVYFCEDNYFMLNKICVVSCPLQFGNISLFKTKTINLNDERYYEYKQCVEKCDKKEVIFNSECISHCPDSFPYINNGVCQQNFCTKNYGYKTFAGIMCVDSCPEQMFGYQGLCVNECPNGLFGYLKGCVKECPQSHRILNISTENYTYKTECVNSCRSPKVVFNSTCIDICPHWTYKNRIECVNECPKNNSIACQETVSEECGRRLYKSSTYNWHKTCLTSCPSNMVVFNKTCVFYCPDNMYDFNGECNGSCPKLYLVQNASVSFLTDESPYLKETKETKKCVKACNENEVVYNHTCFKTCPLPLMVEFNKECMFNCPDHHPLKKTTVKLKGYYNTPDTISVKCSLSCDNDDVVFDQTCMKTCPKDRIYVVRGKCSKEVCENYQLKTERGIDCVDKCPENMLMRKKSCVSDCLLYEIVQNRTCFDNCSTNRPFKCIVTENNVCGEFDSNVMKNSMSKTHYLEFSHAACFSECPNNMFRYGDWCEYFCPENLFLENESCVSSCSTLNGMALWKLKTLILSNGNNQQERIVKLCQRTCDSSEVIFNSTCFQKCPKSAPFIYNGVCQKHQCKTEYSYHIDAGVLCVDSCLGMMFGYQGVCWHACPRGLRGYSHKCVEKCPLSDNLIDISSKQDQKIVKCVRKCDHSKFLMNSTCLDSCPSFTFALNGSCVTKCTKPYKVQQYSNEKHHHECVPVCNNKTVLNGEICVEQCPDYLYVLNKTCVKRCPKTYLFTQQTRFGVECLTSCKLPAIQHNYSCIDNCPNNFRYVVNNTCASECPDLLPIHIKSYDLQNRGDFECVDSCPSFEYRFQNTCVTKCPDKFYKLDGICVEKCSSSKPFLVYESQSCRDSCYFQELYFNGTCIKAEDCNPPNVANGKECLIECPNDLIWHPFTRTCQLASVSYLVIGICFFGTLLIFAVCWKAIKDSLTIQSAIYNLAKGKNIPENYEDSRDDDSVYMFTANQEEFPMLQMD